MPRAAFPPSPAIRQAGRGKDNAPTVRAGWGYSFAGVGAIPQASTPVRERSRLQEQPSPEAPRSRVPAVFLAQAPFDLASFRPAEFEPGSDLFSDAQRLPAGQSAGG